MKITSTKTASNSRLAALIVGPSGIGKTSLAASLPPSETLIVSAEAGLLCLQGTDIDTVEIKNRKDLDEVMRFLTEKTTYKYLFIDSLTEIGDMFLRELKDDPKYADANKAFKLYGAYNDLISAYTKAFRDLTSYSVFVTCLDSTKSDGLEKVHTFNIPGQAVKDNLKSWFDIVFEYKVYQDEEGNPHRKLVTDMAESSLAKDRSGKLNKYEEPNLGEIINKLLKGGVK